VLAKQANSTPGAITINAGALSIAGQSPQTIDGFIDEVIFFSSVLTEADIKSIMAIGLKGATAVSNIGKLVTTWSYIREN